MSGIELKLGRLKKSLELVGAQPNPIMVFGMHRSGTSLLVRILQHLGIFMGSRLSGNLEPRVFQDANRQIFDYFIASWMDAHLLPRPNILFEGFTGLVAGIADRLSDDLPIAFFDSAPKTFQLWGFKEPRLSVTAALFLRLFPDSRAIFIYRNPLDVAWSIAQRDKKQKRKNPGSPNFEFNKKDIQEILMRSVLTWELYNKRAMEGLELFSKYSVLRYESLILEPLKTLTSVYSLIGFRIPDQSIGSHLEFHTDRIGSAEKSGIDLSQIQEYLAKSRVPSDLYKISSCVA